MTDTTTTPRGLWSAGDRLHVRKPLTAWGEVHPRGSVIVLDADLIERSLDRLGQSWLDSEISKPDEARRVGRGDWPDDLPRWIYGDVEWAEQRAIARTAAWAEPDPADRADALRRVEEFYGPAGVSSRTIGGSSNPAEQRAAEAQRARLDASGPRQVNRYAPQRREV